MKTIGPVSSILITSLKKKDRIFFWLREASYIVKRDLHNTSDILCELVKKGLVGRIKSGRFFLIPIEQDKDYIENLYLAARELSQPASYYLSHLSAMAIHGMTSQPSKAIFISSPKRFPNKEINKVLYRFVHCPKKKFWGVTGEWATKQEKVNVSDIEKTIIDCLQRPDLCGGISEIAKGIYYKRQSISCDKLLKYAKRNAVKSAGKRLGFILELFEFNADDIIGGLLNYIKHDQAYVKLDPTLGTKGRYCARWRLILNITGEELKGIIRT